MSSGDTETLTHMNLSWNRIRTPGIGCIAKGIEVNILLLLHLYSSNLRSVEVYSVERILLALITWTDFLLEKDKQFGLRPAWAQLLHSCA